MRFMGARMVAILCFAPGLLSAQDVDVEDVYIARSLRLTRIDATAFCAQDRSGFDKATVEDRYEFKSVSVNKDDGSISDANVATIGTLHACFGNAAEPGVFNFYSEGTLGNINFVGKGECRVVRTDFPEPGLRPSRCFMTLSDLPEGYVGGLLTTNSMTTRNVTGEESNPPGYVQISIATVRLWKKRTTR